MGREKHAEDAYDSTDSEFTDEERPLESSSSSRSSPKKKKSVLCSPLVLGGIFILVLVVTLGAGFLVYKRMNSTDSESTTSSPTSTLSPVVSAAPASLAATHETPSGGSTGGSTGDEEEEEDDGETPLDDCPCREDGGGGGDNEDPEGEGSNQTATSTKSEPTPKPTSGGSSSNSTTSPLTGGDFNVDFSTFGESDDLEEFLAKHGLRIATDHIGSEPITHTFLRENIDIVDGAIRLKVNGQSDDSDIKSAEFGTTDAFLYGRVTTRMRATKVEGVCQGIFFYASDNLEIDIELLSSYYEDGGAITGGIYYTNQALVPGQKATSEVVPFTFDPTADFHDYTIEWKEGVSIFEVDGVEIGRLTENVPSKPMPFIWNNWSSGEVLWSAGPPREDNYMLISAISATWNVANE